MTVIAWDGTSLAADKQCTAGGTIYTTTKIWQSPSGKELLAFCGDIARGCVMRDWWLAGAYPDKFPTFAKDDDDADLFVIQRLDRSRVRAMKFERYPVPYIIEDKFFAVGCGRDYAIGALAMGATARQAVEIACRHDSWCGGGIDVLELP